MARASYGALPAPLATEGPRGIGSPWRVHHLTVDSWHAQRPAGSLRPEAALDSISLASKARLLRIVMAPPLNMGPL